MNLSKLPVYEPGLAEIVKNVEGKIFIFLQRLEK